MERELSDLRARGADVIAVGPGGEKATALTRRALKVSYPLLGDPDGEVYARFGFARVLGVIQQSGTIVLDAHGTVLLAHRSANPASALPLAEIKAALA